MWMWGVDGWNEGDLALSLCLFVLLHTLALLKKSFKEEEEEADLLFIFIYLFFYFSLIRSDYTHTP